jgi:predicted TPR repeat methyltransferase
VLEIDCGTGMFTRMFAPTGARIVAVDISGDILAKARERGLPADRLRFLNLRRLRKWSYILGVNFSRGPTPPSTVK